MRIFGILVVSQKSYSMTDTLTNTHQFSQVSPFLVRQCLLIMCFDQYCFINLLSLTNQHKPTVQYAGQLSTEHSSYRRSTLRFYLLVVNSGIWAVRIKTGSRVATCNTRYVPLSSNKGTDNYHHYYHKHHHHHHHQHLHNLYIRMQ